MHPCPISMSTSISSRLIFPLLYWWIALHIFLSSLDSIVSLHNSSVLVPFLGIPSPTILPAVYHLFLYRSHNTSFIFWYKIRYLTTNFRRFVSSAKFVKTLIYRDIRFDWPQIWPHKTTYMQLSDIFAHLFPIWLTTNLTTKKQIFSPNFLLKISVSISSLPISHYKFWKKNCHLG